MPPDGAVQGKTIELLRNMLVREYKNDLYLFSVISPDWMKPDKSIEVQNEPTYFGPVTAVMRVTSGGFIVDLSNQFRQAPQRIVIRVPWFYKVQRVEVDGREVKPAGAELVLSPSARKVTVTGGLKPGTPEMSFNRAVEDYKRESDSATRNSCGLESIALRRSMMVALCFATFHLFLGRI